MYYYMNVHANCTTFDILFTHTPRIQIMPFTVRSSVK